MIAIFDFDQTLVREHSLRALFRALAAPWPLWARTAPALWQPRLFRHGLKSGLKAHLYPRLLQGRSRDELRHAAAQVARRLRLHPRVAEALHGHARAGASVIVASASPRLALEVMLRDLRLPVDHIVATELEEHSGVLTGSILGAECIGMEKARRLRASLDTWQLDGVRTGYGNLPEDGPMLDLCERRVAVARGWRWNRPLTALTVQSHISPLT